MKHRGPILAAAWACLILVWAVGCEQPTPSAATTRPALKPLAPAAPATGPAPREVRVIKLPPRAALTLAQIEPKIQRPTSRPSQAPLSERIRPEVEEAEKRLAAGDFAGAVDRLERAVGFEPNLARVRRMLGVAYLGMSNFGKGAEHLRRAAELADDSLETHLLLGKIALTQRQHPAAMASLRTAIACSEVAPENPQAAEAYLLLGKLLAQEGYWQAALDCLTLVYDWIEPNARAYAARPALRPVVMRPDQLLTQRGELLLKLRRHSEAMELLEWAFSRDKSNPANAQLLMQAMVDAGQFERARKFLLPLADQPSQKAQLTRMTLMICEGWQDKGMDPAVGLDLLSRAVEVDDSDMPAVRQSIERLAAKVPEDFDRTFAQQARQKRTAGLLFVSGELARARGKNLLAAEQFTMATEVRKDFLPAYETVLDIHLASKRFAQVDHLLQRLGEAMKESHAYFYLQGKVRLARGDAAGAVLSLQDAHAANKEHVPTLLLLSDAYSLTQAPRDAEQALLKALNLPGDNMQVYRKLFAQYLDREEYQNASNVVEKVRQLSSDPLQARRMEAHLLLARGELEQARKVVQALEEEAPANSEVRLLSLRAMLASRTGTLSREEFNRAVQLLTDIIRREPTNLSAKRQLAELLEQAGRSDEAMATWGRLYDQSNGEVEIARQYVAALFRAGRHEVAITVLRGLLKQDPKDLLARLQLMEALDKLKDYDEGVRTVEKWLDEEPKAQAERNNYRRLLVRFCESAKQFDKAHKALDQWIASSTLEEEGILWRIQKLQLYGAAEQYDQAVEFAQKWKQSAGEESEIPTRLLVAVLARGKRMDQAEKVCRDWIKQSPDSISAKELLVAVLSQAKKYDQAMAMLEEWIGKLQGKQIAAMSEEELETLREYRQSTIRLLVRQSKYEEALKRCEAYHKSDPADGEMLNMKSTALAELGRHDAALEALEAAYKMDPTSAAFNNNLGYMLAERNFELERAERMIRHALVDRPTELAYKDSLGWVFYKQSKFREAARVFEDVLRQAQDDESEHAVLMDHAGDVQWRLGEKEQALRLWQQALESLAKEEVLTAELRQVKARTPKKIEDAKAGREPQTSPVGQVERPKPPAKAGEKPAAQPATRPAAA